MGIKFMITCIVLAVLVGVVGQISSVYRKNAELKQQTVLLERELAEVKDWCQRFKRASENIARGEKQIDESHDKIKRDIVASSSGTVSGAVRKATNWLVNKRQQEQSSETKILNGG